MLNRKKRSDRNHIIYEIFNTFNGKSYLGITACIGRRTNYSVVNRFNKHCSRAKMEDKDWALYRDMKIFNKDVYELYIIEVVRGKALAHQKEVEYLKEYNYELNSTH
jgi:hypothetical protein